MGPVNVECSVSVHTAPFGNWGVTSNFGSKTNGHQFQGWCHDSRICDNSGFCRTDCLDGWYEWNSCTDASLYRAPNCSLYNSNGCTEQVSNMGVNVLGTKTVDVPVRCPMDTNGDGVMDTGGCKDVSRYASGTNFMTLYELDPGGPDELVQTMYFPEITLNLDCGVWGCAQTGSTWMTPTFYDSPVSPAKVYAEMAVVMSSALFMDTGRRCPLSGPTVTSVSAASLSSATVAAESIVTGFGEVLATTVAEATVTPPPTSLAGTTIRVTDRTGAARLAPIYYVSARQVNYQMPAGVASGAATVTVTSGSGISSTGVVQVATVAPGLFSARGDGQGSAAAVAVKVAADGSQTWQYTSDCASGACVSVPIDMGNQTVLLLFGTGIRRHSGLGTVSVKIGGQDGVVQFAGAQGQYVGLDQVNVLLPPSLRGSGEVPVVLTVGGVAANTVTVNFR